MLGKCRKRARQLRDVIGLLEKELASRQTFLRLAFGQAPRRHRHADFRMVLAYPIGKLEAVIVIRQLHVGEDGIDRNVVETGNRLVCVAGLGDFETLVPQDLRDAHPDEQLVLYDQDGNRFFRSHRQARFPVSHTTPGFAFVSLTIIGQGVA